MPKNKLKDIKQCWDIVKLHVQSITKIILIKKISKIVKRFLLLKKSWLLNKIKANPIQLG